MDKILTVAAKEFKDGFRNRWIIAITVIFAVFSLGLTYLGSAASGSIGFSSLSSTMISLASLAVFLIPLIALMIAYNAFVGEYEQGTMLLLLTYPISRYQMLFGKLLGQGSIITIAAILGFGSAAISILITSDADQTEVIKSFSGFILSAVLLGWVFISIAYVISLLANEKSRAAGLALIIWFVFVLVFDLVLLAVLVTSKGDLSNQLIGYLFYFNPTDIFRLMNYHIAGASELGGALQIAQQTSFSNLIIALILWILIPLGLASYLFKKRDI